MSTNLARERLQIDTDLQLIIASTADELSDGTSIDDLKRPWNRKKIAGFSDFFAILGCDVHLKSEFSQKLLDIDRQHAYEIKLTLSRVAWALAHISSAQPSVCSVFQDLRWQVSLLLLLMMTFRRQQGRDVTSKMASSRTAVMALSTIDVAGTTLQLSLNVQTDCRTIGLARTTMHRIDRPTDGELPSELPISAPCTVRLAS